MRLPALVVLGAIAYGAFLAATVPAGFALRHAEDAARGRLAVHAASGTVWNGEARASIGTPGGRLVLERVAWRWLPSALSSGRLAWDLVAQAPGLEARFEGARSFTRWELRGLEAKAGAGALVAALPWIAAWRPEGQVVVASPLLSTDGRDLRGEARVEWRGAAVGLSEVKPLGSWRAEMRADGPAARIAVSTLAGPLQLRGEGTLTLPAQLAFSGEARAEGPQAAALAPLLDLLGPRRADGARTLSWRTR